MPTVIIKFELSHHESQVDLHDYGHSNLNWDDLSDDEKSEIIDDSRRELTIYSDVSQI